VEDTCQHGLRRLNLATVTCGMRLDAGFETCDSATDPEFCTRRRGTCSERAPADEASTAANPRRALWPRRSLPWWPRRPPRGVSEQTARRQMGARRLLGGSLWRELRRTAQACFLYAPCSRL